MPGIINGGIKKRKRAGEPSAQEKAAAVIRRLEQQIGAGDSRDHYNNIVHIHAFVQKVQVKPKTAMLAATALCRVFCRFIAADLLRHPADAQQADRDVVLWLRARLHGYVASLRSWIGSPHAALEMTAVTLLMRIVKAEASQPSHLRAEQAWKADRSTFHLLVQSLLEKTDAEAARQEFVDKYVEEHDDVRYYTFSALSHCFKTSSAHVQKLANNAIALLSQLESVPEFDYHLEDWYGEPPPQSHRLRSLAAHHKCAREAWLTVFRTPLTSAHRKHLLGIANTHILPWFTTRVELLADMLTDSFAAGGALALLALESIFHLMTKKNLDYPDFYTKLYSLLDDTVLHSKHRSRFFRLLETLLASSHLPAAMIASFMKRFSRLALQAPPGAIVWIVPWTYNMLKAHPACTFMLHRPFHRDHKIYATQPKYAEEGIDDPFDMNEPDPMRTKAIESSLWELETLRTHWHPNVATLARILGEQFTKREYQLEDFQNHSYATLVEAELGKEMKKTPVVEWQIPKHIVTRNNEENSDRPELNGFGKLLEEALAVSFD